jgi:hypothetical protein
MVQFVAHRPAARKVRLIACAAVAMPANRGFVEP